MGGGNVGNPKNTRNQGGNAGSHDGRIAGNQGGNAESRVGMREIRVILCENLRVYYFV